MGKFANIFLFFYQCIVNTVLCKVHTVQEMGKLCTEDQRMHGISRNYLATNSGSASGDLTQEKYTYTG
jgi:hypothetical protein